MTGREDIRRALAVMDAEFEVSSEVYTGTGRVSRPILAMRSLLKAIAEYLTEDEVAK